MRVENISLFEYLEANASEYEEVLVCENKMTKMHSQLKNNLSGFQLK
jgi:hypothetical protein